MNPKLKKTLKTVLLLFLLLILFFAGYFFIGKPPQAEKIIWGITFSQKHAEQLGLDWKAAYLSLLDDLQVKNLRIVAQWDVFEPEEGKYNYDDIDWQIEKAQQREAKIILIMGMKTPRWPECNIPEWAKKLGKSQQQEKILKMLGKIVLRYQNSSAIRYWQVENEPFFSFGNCPWADKKFVKKEVELVKSLDEKKRPILITESGELSTWFGAARIGDIVGTTMYRQTWWHKAGGFYTRYPFQPVYYWRKAQLIKKIFNKKVICVELQAEPWGPQLLYDLLLEEQKKTMNLEQFQKNVEFARKTGLDEFYLWGVEWWYWMKEVQGQPEVWQEAKNLFMNQ